MSIVVEDLIGLNATAVHDMPIVRDQAQSLRLLAGPPDLPLSIAGMRHSQGGHTAQSGGRMLLTETYNQIHSVTEVAGPNYHGLIDVDAGATWTDVHRALGAKWLAPMVQQSSAHFTVGGSLSVNCHGRDPRWGPISSTVEDLTVLTGLGALEKVSRAVKPDLFKAVLGGYGACGQIVRATLRATRNMQLQYIGGRANVIRLNSYAQRLSRMLQPGAPPDNVELHYGWICCVRGGDFYDEVLHVDIKTGLDGRYEQRTFEDEAWGTNEIMRAGWAASRKSPDVKDKVWNALVKTHAPPFSLDPPPKETLNGKVKSRADWLRSSVSFTAFRDVGSADILQEYFVPPGRFPAMMAALKALYSDPACPINVLSTTVRVVRQDAETLLSYCANGPMVCIAVDAHAPTAQAAGGWVLHPDAVTCVNQAIQAALANQGSYYLPYQLAPKAAFEAAYPAAARAKLQQAIDTWNPRVNGKHRYWNRFLDTYFQ